MEPETKKQLFYWFMFVLFLLYILIWLVTLFGLPPSILEFIFSFPSGMYPYLLVDYKAFGKDELDELGETNKAMNDATKKK
jgi:hypothetical protein